ncbi:ABC transporter substrate-binding protein [Alkaliphilus peptidifermentans]|uniref:Multiple sugar transport system substrate-binding protein n=1 Tax=Alkaliphilus peptidifermentans DSM 18978 TaxID=1120976 RepID=A0A1G5L5T2_9FIRM|nr:sugar ABC transporter substrate-binding protein [Alkaliphilus peptidifermentans]SCZ08227.1 multiple sugar transport system substrate-binding protein [Alkaliphilus peptidifermentans DSM 18978]
MKKGFLFLLIVMITIAAVGCGKSKKNVIRFATWDSAEVLEVQRDIAKRFEELNPGVKVQVEAYADGYSQKLAAGFGAKNPPDVMYMWDFPTYSASLESLNQYMEEDQSFKAILADLFPGIINYSTIDNQIYGLPVGYTSHVIYYNKAIFDEAGIPYPTNDWTWDEFREIARKVSDPSVGRYGFAVPTQPDPYDFEQFLWTDGTAYIAPDGSTVDGYLNSEATINRMQFFADMIKEGSALGAQESISRAFRGGNVVIQESGIWPLAAHIEAIGEENLGIVGLPRASKTVPASSVINSSAISMAKDAKNKELAWEFIKFYSSPEAVKMRAKTDLPVLKSVADELGYNEDPFYAPFYQMLETAENNTPAFLLHPQYSRIAEEISNAIEKIFVDTINGETVNVREILNYAVEESKQYFTDK